MGVKQMKRVPAFVFTLLLTLSLCACDEEYIIYGRWCREDKESATITFTDDGKCYDNDTQYDYSIEDDKLTLIDTESGNTLTASYSISHNRLTISDSDGYITVWIRK